MKKKYRYQDENGQWVKGFYDEKEVEELISYGFKPEQVTEYYNPNDEDKENPYYDISENEVADFMQAYPQAMLKSDYESQLKKKEQEDRSSEKSRREYERSKKNTTLQANINEISLNQQDITSLVVQYKQPGVGEQQRAEIKAKINALTQKNKQLLEEIKGYDPDAYQYGVLAQDQTIEYLDNNWDIGYTQDFWNGYEKNLNEKLDRAGKKAGIKTETIATNSKNRFEADRGLGELDKIHNQIVSLVSEVKQKSQSGMDPQTIKSIYDNKFEGLSLQAETFASKLGATLGKDDQWRIKNIVDSIRWYKDSILGGANSPGEIFTNKNFDFYIENSKQPDNWYNKSRKELGEKVGIVKGGTTQPSTPTGLDFSVTDINQYRLNSGNRFRSLTSEDLQGYSPEDQERVNAAMEAAGGIPGTPGYDANKALIAAGKEKRGVGANKVVKAAVDDYFDYYEKVNPEMAKMQKATYEAYLKNPNLNAYQQGQKLQFEQKAVEYANKALLFDLDRQKNNVEVLNEQFKGIDFQTFSSEMAIISKKEKEIKSQIDGIDKKMQPLVSDFETHKNSVEQEMERLNKLYEEGGVSREMYEALFNDLQQSLTQKQKELESKIKEITGGVNYQEEIDKLNKQKADLAIKTGVNEDIYKLSEQAAREYQTYDDLRSKLGNMEYIMQGWDDQYPDYKKELEQNRKIAEYRAKGSESELGQAIDNAPFWKQALYYGYKYLTPAGLLKETEIGRGFSQSVGSGILGITQLPEVFYRTFGGESYTWTTELYDWFQDVNFLRQGEFGDYTAYGYEQSTTDYLTYLGGNVVGSLALFASGGTLGGSTKVGQVASTFSTSYLTSLGDTYTDMLSIAKENDRSPQWAAAQSQAITVVLSAIESAIPDIKYFEPSAARKSIVQAIKSGKTVKESIQGFLEALPDSVKAYLKSSGKEGLEEWSAKLAEDVYKSSYNSISGVQYFNDTWDPSAHLESILGGVIGGVSGNFFSRPNGATTDIKLAMYESAENGQRIIDGAKNEKQRLKLQNDMKAPMESFSQLSSHANWDILHKEDRVEAFFLSQQINDLQKKVEENKKNGIEDKASENKLKEYQDGLNTILNSVTAEQAKGYNAHKQGVSFIVSNIGTEADFGVIEDSDVFQSLDEESQAAVTEIRQKMMEVAKDIDETGSEESTNTYTVLQSFVGNILNDPSSYKNGDYPWRIVEDTDNEIPMLEDKRSQYVSSRMHNLITEDVNRDQAQQIAREEWLKTDDGKRYLLLTQNKDDQKNRKGVPSEEQQGKESVQTKSVETRSAEETTPGGVVQGTQEEVTPEIAPKAISEISPEESTQELSEVIPQEMEAEEAKTEEQPSEVAESKPSTDMEAEKTETETKQEEKQKETKLTEDEEADALFNSAASFTSRVQMMSPKILMAKFGMSANQADLVMAKMQANGIISEQDSTGQSQVLMKPYQVAPIIDERRARVKEEARKQEQQKKLEQERASMTPEEVAYEENIDKIKGDIASIDPTLNDSSLDTAARLFANGLSANEAISKAKAEQKFQTRENRKKSAAANRVTLPQKGKPYGKPMNISDAVTRLGQALKTAGISTRVAESQDEFNKLAKEYGLDPNKTEGFFVSTGKNPQIIFNKKDLEGKYGKTILFHEGTHPIINIIRNTDPKLYKKLVDGLNKLAGKNKQVNKVREQIKKAVSEESFEDEFIVETIAQISSGVIDPSKLDKGVRSSLIKWMNKIAKMLGFGQIPINASTDEIINLAGKIKDVFEEGRDISEIVGEKNVNKYELKFVQPRAIELLMGKEDLSKYGLEPGKRYNVRQIYQAFEKRQRDLFGQIQRDDYSDKTMKQLAEWAKDEVMFMMTQFPNESGTGWYTTKFQAAIDEVAKIFPELATDKDQRSLFTMLVAIYSDGTKVEKNMSNAIMAYSDYKKTGVIPNTDTGGERNVSFNSNINEINSLIADFDGDLEAMTKYLLEEKSGSKLAQEAKENGEEFKTDWPAEMILPVASRVFGPKLGMFYSNLMGKEGYPTLDRWFSRLFNRYRGDLMPRLTGLKGKEKDTKGQFQGVARFKSLIGKPGISDAKAVETAKERALQYGSRTKLGDASKSSKMLSPIEKKVGMKQGPDKASKEKFKKAAKAAGIKLTSPEFKAHEQFVKDRTGGFWTELEGKVGFKQGNKTEQKERFDAAAAELGFGPDSKLYKNHLADKAANTIYKAAFVALNDAPFNRKDRKFMFDTLVQAREMLKKEGVDVTVADIQAILWYYEKKLYVSQGGLESAMGISYEEAAQKSVKEYIKNGGQLDTEVTEEDLIDEDGDIDPETGELVQPSRNIDRSSIDETNKSLEGVEKIPPSKVKGFSEGVSKVQEVAKEYKQQMLKGRTAKMQRANEPVFNLFSKVSKIISDAYDAIKNDPDNKEVKKAYEALVEETKQQYEFIISKGLNVVRHDGVGEPYPNSKEMLRDIRENNTLKFLPNDVAFGEGGTDISENIGLQPSGIKLADGYELTNSEVFRVVHDYFGHGILGNEFGAIGEENATLQHLDLYSDEAAPAVIFQTRGQNSWVNFSGVNDSANELRKQARELKKEGKIEEANKLFKEADKIFKFAEPKINIFPGKLNFKRYETARRINEQQEIDTRADKRSDVLSKLLEEYSKRSSGTRGVNKRDVQGVKRIGSFDLNVKAEYDLDKLIDSNIKKAFPDFKGVQKIYEITDGSAYRQMMIDSLKDNKFAASVTVHSAQDFDGMRMFVTEDGSTGITLTKEGFLGGAFSNPNAKRPQNLAQLMLIGIKEGATTAEAFDTILPDYYSNFGFKAVSRTAFNDNYRPLIANGNAVKDWDYETYKNFNNGRPDVVFFIYDGGDRNTIEDRLGLFDLYQNYEKSNTKDFNNNEYDKAEEVMKQQAVKRLEYELGIQEDTTTSVQPSGVIDRSLPADLEIVNGFYSPIEKSLRETKAEKQSANKWLSGGIIGKGDEAVYTGVRQWLESKNPQEQVSKQEILDWMKNNRIEIKEVVKKGSYSPSEQEIDSFIERQSEFDDEEVTREIAREALMEQYRDQYSDQEATRFSQYQLEGEKENYKEVLVTLPEKPYHSNDVSYIKVNGEWYGAESAKVKLGINNIRNLSTGETVNGYFIDGTKQITRETNDNFRSSHFEEPNILVHLRMNTRTDADGNKVLFLEEVQSDWGQEGKKKGFDNKQLEAKRSELLDKMYTLELEHQSYTKRTKIADTGRVSDFVLESTNEKRQKEIEAEIGKLDAEVKKINKQIGLTPSAPFVTDTNAWVKLGLKMALREAVNQGADKIAWTTGEQQNERYDLSKQVDNINYYKNEDGTYRVYAMKNGGTVFSEDALPENKLEESFGKEVASKMINNEGYKPDGMKGKRLDGDNLKVGGKGMKGFYDKIVPDVAKALVKELTGQKVEVGETKLQTTTSVNKSDNPILQFRDWVWKNKTEDYSYGDAKNDIDSNSKLYQEFLSDKSSTQQSIDVTPELVNSVKRGMPQASSNIDREQSDKQNAIDKQFLESNKITSLDVNRWLSDNNFESLLDPKAREKFNTDFKVTLPPLQEIMNVDQLDTAIQSGIDSMGSDLDQNVPFSQAFSMNIKSKPWYNLLTDNQKAELEEEARSIYAEEYAEESGNEIADNTPNDKANKLVELWYKKKDGQRDANDEMKRILASDEKLKYIWNNISPILRQLENKGILTKTAGCP